MKPAASPGSRPRPDIQVPFQVSPPCSPAAAHSTRTGPQCPCPRPSRPGRPCSPSGAHLHATSLGRWVSGLLRRGRCQGLVAWGRKPTPHSPAPSHGDRPWWGGVSGAPAPCRAPMAEHSPPVNPKRPLAGATRFRVKGSAGAACLPVPGAASASPSADRAGTACPLLTPPGPARRASGALGLGCRGQDLCLHLHLWAPSTWLRDPDRDPGRGRDRVGRSRGSERREEVDMANIPQKHEWEGCRRGPGLSCS